MYLLYLDEFGHAGKWIPGDPRFGHHPMFGLSGFAIPASKWADIDRSFYRLKCDLYKAEIRQIFASKGIRAERYEPKQIKSRRDMIFAAEVMNLVQANDGHLFAFGYIKPIAFAKHRDNAIYNGSVEGSMTNFEKYMRDRSGKTMGRGIIIMDRRNDALNEIVLGAAQSFIFGRSASKFGLPIDRIVEAPLLVPSEWYHGVQMADMIGRSVATVYKHRLGIEKGLNKFDQLLGAKLDNFAYTKDRWSTVFLDDWR